MNSILSMSITAGDSRVNSLGSGLERVGQRDVDTLSCDIKHDEENDDAISFT